ncbi:DUF1820 family protein [Alteromonas sp. a30]|uniref:DUF1820 family protein n=1 Tax=Alteromonas sp. a30 TaxID=2730917 RepID=UPI00227DEF60|nr:DUF1820 family protein [Alteromonas sp. a30]MCY7295774.1 DUF1820 family protein [Alteromonas sp. a30]
MSTAKKPLYRIQFINNGEHYELYVHELLQSHLFGFIEIGDFVWDTHTSLVLDPSHEKLKNEFSNVNRTYIPLHSIIKIDEVKERGTAKISELSDKIAQFPKPIYTPKN